MKSITSLARQSFLFLILLGLLNGCNLFSGLHHDGVESNSHVLVADGKAALDQGDYANAAEYFRLAIKHNPQDSEARVGYAEAYLKAHGFSLGDFINSFISKMDDEDLEDLKLAVPTEWGCADLNALISLLNTLVDTLDPIALGQTQGPYRQNDIKVNINTGIFYIMKIAAQIQTISTDFEIKMLTKGSTEVNNLNPPIPPAILAALPDEFMWIVDSSGSQPSAGFLLQMQSDIDAGLARLQTAADNSSSKEMIEDIIDLFDDWQILAYQ